ncbi:MAG: AzlD domain-containing protein [Actinobacteria bacterium]|nr:AzlD domain-containing protein [Actinomycetota bacterium]
MSLSSRGWIAIVLIGIGTYTIRASFLLIAHRFEGLSSTTREVLRMIPAAALAALTAPALLRPERRLDLVSPELFAGLIALAVAWWTRSILATIGVGLVAVALLGYLPI